MRIAPLTAAALPPLLGLALALFSALAPVVSGCAALGPEPQSPAAARPTLHYTDGRYFRIAHSEADLSAESAERPFHDGGTISGRVCGMDFIYDVWLDNTAVVLTGFVSNAWSATRTPSTIQIHDHDGRRLIFGYSGQTLGAGTPTIDLTLTPEGLSGQVATRFFQLHVNGDSFVGHMRLGERGRGRGGIPFRADGRADLWGMPAADQGILVPALLACTRWQGNLAAPMAHVSFNHLAGPPRSVDEQAASGAPGALVSPTAGAVDDPSPTPPATSLEPPVGVGITDTTTRTD